MSTPHRCPICKGRGNLKKKKARAGAKRCIYNPKRFACHACFGSGIIWSYDWKPVIPPCEPPQWIVYTSNDPTIQDGVTRCISCDEPHYMEPAHDCQQASSHYPRLREHHV